MQRLRNVDVPQTCDNALIRQRHLERPPAPDKLLRQRRSGKAPGERLGTETCDGAVALVRRQQRDEPEASRVVEDHDYVVRHFKDNMVMRVVLEVAAGDAKRT